MTDDINLNEAPLVACGFPSPAQDYTEGLLDFNEYLNIKKASVFALKAKGNSMINVGIFDGDIIIVDKSKEATHNALVVASLDDCFTLKRLILHPQILLRAENADYPDIVASNLSELKIFGVITGIVRKL